MKITEVRSGLQSALNARFEEAGYALRKADFEYVRRRGDIRSPTWGEDSPFSPVFPREFTDRALSDVEKTRVCCLSPDLILFRMTRDIVDVIRR